MPLESPAATLYDDFGIALAVTSGVALPVSTSALVFAGVTPSGTTAYAKMTSDGTVYVTGSISTSVTFPTLQNVYVTNTLTSSVNGAQVVNQGLSGSIGQSWYTSITDGTKVLGTGSSAPIWITGSVSVAFPALQNVNILGPITSSNSGSFVSVKETKSNTAVVTAVARTNTVTTILSGNLQRTGVSIFNDSGAILYLRFGPDVATTTIYSTRLSANSYLEIPYWFTGLVTGVWQSAGGGNALVTEFSN